MIHNSRAVRVREWSELLSQGLEAEDWTGLARELDALKSEDAGVFAFAVGEAGFPKGLAEKLVNHYRKFGDRCEKNGIEDVSEA